MHRDRLLYAGEYLEANLFEPLTMEDIAAASAMSLRSLQRHFVGAVGESLASYVRGRRLTQAAQQLVLGHEDILSLALDCQFGSHEAFTRAFERHYFMSPSEFRKQGCLTHNYHRPNLDEAMLGELAAQHNQPPRIVERPAEWLWGLSRELPADAMAGPALMQEVSLMQAQLRALFGARAAPRTLLFKRTPGQCRHFCVMVAVEARSGLPPLGLEALPLPAGFRATFTMQGDEQLLPVFMYHCYAQWIFHSGWHFADAPVELHFPYDLGPYDLGPYDLGPSEREPRFRLTLPVRTTPSPHYLMW